MIEARSTESNHASNDVSPPQETTIQSDFQRTRVHRPMDIGTRTAPECNPRALRMTRPLRYQDGPLHEPHVHRTEPGQDLPHASGPAARPASLVGRPRTAARSWPITLAPPRASREADRTDAAQPNVAETESAGRKHQCNRRQHLHQEPKGAVVSLRRQRNHTQPDAGDSLLSTE